MKTKKVISLLEKFKKTSKTVSTREDRELKKQIEKSEKDILSDITRYQII